jgi:hypothetical protein
MAAGKAFTVTAFMLLQPLPVEYEITATPAATPVTTPELLTVATVVVLLLHVPPDVASEKVVDEPAQMLPEPLMAASSLTVTTAVVVQPVLMV